MFYWMLNWKGREPVEPKMKAITLMGGLDQGHEQVTRLKNRNQGIKVSLSHTHQMIETTLPTQD